MLVIGTKIVSTVYMYDRDVTTCIQTVNKTIKGQNSKHIRHRDWNGAISME